MPPPSIHHAGAMPVISLLGQDLRVLLGAEETGGTHSIFELTAPPGDGPPPHVHAHEDETFIVLEGTLEFLVGSGGDGRLVAHRVSAGGCIYGPRGVPHTYRNPGTSTARALVITTPSGFERFARAVEQRFPAGAAIDMPALVSIMVAHGITPVTAS